MGPNNLRVSSGAKRKSARRSRIKKCPLSASRKTVRRTKRLMDKTQFAIETDDLSAYKTAELKRMLNFVDFGSELVAEVDGWCKGDTLPDLEEAMTTWLSAM